jgi:hypothetical protein
MGDQLILAAQDSLSLIRGERTGTLKFYYLKILFKSSG